jgi:hypothetical protein
MRASRTGTIEGIPLADLAEAHRQPTVVALAELHDAASSRRATYVDAITGLEAILVDLDTAHADLAAAADHARALS